MRILVAGCGYVGSALARRLVEEGHRVWGLRRRPRDLPRGVEPIAADMTDPGSLRDLPDRLDLLFYTASPDGAEEESYHRAYLEGPANLLAAIAGAPDPPRRIFYTSSTGVYAQGNGEWVDESSPTEPERPTARILLEGERRLLAGPLPATVVRFAGIYGPGRTRLIRSVRDGTAVCRDPSPWTNRIHRDDCAGVLHHLMGLPEPEPVYIGADDDPARRCDVLRWIAERLGVAAPPVEPGSPGSLNKRCRNARLRGSRYTFLYPTFREGYAELLKTPGRPPASP